MASAIYAEGSLRSSRSIEKRDGPERARAERFRVKDHARLPERSSGIRRLNAQRVAKCQLEEMGPT
ncbi:hypothetical protein GCM10009556_095960 [Acrocarpospora pleiomorpha]